MEKVVFKRVTGEDKDTKKKSFHQTFKQYSNHLSIDRKLSNFFLLDNLAIVHLCV